MPTAHHTRTLAPIRRAEQKFDGYDEMLLQGANRAAERRLFRLNSEG
jgi:hypothetical protein